MPASPLATVKEKFGSKDKLVDQVVDLLAKTTDEPKDELRKRLAPVANRKLLRLHAVATQVKEAGGRDKLVAEAAGLLGKAKDKPFIEKLESYSSARLLDTARAARRRARG